MIARVVSVVLRSAAYALVALGLLVVRCCES